VYDFKILKNEIFERPVMTLGDDCHLRSVPTLAAKHTLVLLSVATLTLFWV